MQSFTYYEIDTGAIQGSGSTPDAAAWPLQPGQALHVGEALSARQYYFVGGLPVAYTDAERECLSSRPAHAVRWDVQAKSWQDLRDLAALRVEKWNEIRRRRDMLEATSFAYLGRQIESDIVSVLRINTAVRAADFAQAQGAPFATQWRCADNSLLALDGPALQLMPVALAAHAQALHTHANGLRAQIEAATTAEQLRAITWGVVNA